MLREKMFSRIITIVLILCLIYANLCPAIFGVISYATNNGEEKEIIQEEKKKPISIEISEFSKNNMLEKETEYFEKILLHLDYENAFNEVVISDIGSIIDEAKINTFYKNTKINKSDLIDAIGKDGTLEIEYKQLTQESKDEEDIIKLPNQEDDGTIYLPQEEIIILPEDGIINAEDGLVKINKDTPADEEGYITVIYPENVDKIDLKINTNTNKIEKLEIVNNKIINKVTDIEKVNVLETNKNILVKGEKEFLNSVETIKTPIQYTKTVAELGLDKSQISTTVENKVNFTITMATDKVIYDLYKNPQFIIELPNEVKTIRVDNTIILNNNKFEVESIEYGKLNENQAILIKLKGEQTEYTKSALENTQILLETTITTKNLIPTLERVVNLYYQNENANTYDGIGKQENGVSSVPVTLVSNKEIIVQTTAIVGETTVTSLRENYETITLEPETNKSAEIIGTAINNTGKDIENALILGTATNIGKLSGVEKVYYTENADATADLTDANNMWTAEHTENAKKYLIVIDTFKQGQTVTFKYTMNLPENIKEDIEHIAQFEIYNSESIKTSKVTIYQEAKRLDIFEDDKIKATISFDNEKVIQIGDKVKCQINIANKSNEKLENVELEVIVPEGLTNVDTVSIKDGRYLMLDNTIEDNVLTIKNVNIDDNITIAVNMDLEEYVSPSATIKANIKYLEKEVEVSNGIKILSPSTIQATLTSNKLGTTLEENEEIEYTLTLKNDGESHIRVNVTLPELEEMNIFSIKTINKTTLEEKQIMSTDLSREINMIDINSEEIVEVLISAKAKSLEQNKKITMYAEITGDRIEKIVTGKLTNKVNKAVVEETEENQVETQEQVNTISGKAWVDKNENGAKDNNEVVLKGVQAVLINTKTSDEVATVRTNNLGEYQFKNIVDGTYVVEFRYNTNTFNITEYKNIGANEISDSDVVNATQNNKTVIKTEVIDIEDGATENVNIGLVINQKFDMSIKKGITKVTVNNEQNTNTYDFNNNNMAKVEIDGKYLKGSLIIVEYEIAVTNIGEISGYAKLISDQLPEGMKFSSELNTNWYEGENGKIYCEALADKELLPGETAVVKLVLIKEMTDDKITSPSGISKIEETFNEYLIEDKTKDNNIAEATIIISLTTGKTESYIWLITLVLTIIGIGTFGTIKIVKRDVAKVTNRGKEYKSDEK